MTAESRSFDWLIGYFGDKNLQFVVFRGLLGSNLNERVSCVTRCNQKEPGEPISAVEVHAVVHVSAGRCCDAGGRGTRVMGWWGTVRTTVVPHDTPPGPKIIEIHRKSWKIHRNSWKFPWQCDFLSSNGVIRVTPSPLTCLWLVSEMTSTFWHHCDRSAGVVIEGGVPYCCSPQKVFPLGVS